jgi:osmotically-inducible protein OsmY
MPTFVATWSRIAEAVANALSDVSPGSGRIQSVVQDGIVTLSGHASCNEQRSAALNAVSRLAGVKGVLNSIATTAQS